jgi:RimJ/RimL family protein N-acetyltransferase
VVGNRLHVHARSGAVRLVFGDDARVGAWIEDHEGGQYRLGSQCIGLERRGELVAGALFDYHNGASVYVHLALAHKRALTRSFLHACFRYAFVQLECEVLIGLVAGDNFAAQRLDEHLGFVLEHSIKGAHPSGELRIYTMRKDQCRWL